MQKNKYLDDLGLDITDYGTNFSRADDRRQAIWQAEREEYGFDARECWDLDETFIEWLYSHLMKYKEDNNVDLACHENKINYAGQEFTHEEVLNMMLENLRFALVARGTTNRDLAKERNKKVREAILIWAESYTAFWW